MIHLCASASFTVLLIRHFSFTLSNSHLEIITSWLLCPYQTSTVVTTNIYLRQKGGTTWSLWVLILDSGKIRLNYHVVGQLLQDMIPSLAREPYQDPNGVSAGYSFYYLDLSVNKIFIDDNYHITCAID